MSLLYQRVLLGDKMSEVSCFVEKKRLSLSSSASTTVESECGPSLSELTDPSECAISLSGSTDEAREEGDFFGLDHQVEAEDVLERLSAEYRPDADSCSDNGLESSACHGHRIRTKKRKSGWSRRRQQNFWQSVRETSPERWPEYHYNDGESFIMLTCTP